MNNKVSQKLEIIGFKESVKKYTTIYFFIYFLYYIYVLPVFSVDEISPNKTEDLQAVFFCVSESLKEGGIFIFDINTPYKYEVLMADNTIAENRDEGSFIWDNYYDADEKINEYDLTLFIKEQSEDEDDIYKKFEETHFQRCYEISELKELLEQSGLVFDAVYDAYTDDQVKCDSEKVTVIAHKA